MNRKKKTLTVTLLITTTESLQMLRDKAIWQEAVQLFAFDDDGSMAVEQVIVKRQSKKTLDQGRAKA